ncbi:unannotated protein [freshwater metagenome]|uniref:Unannotated protein n=1 Tax=freshwater metagenome TaxID=449393 RepID=A0A6J6F3V3_9ZZZZ
MNTSRCTGFNAVSMACIIIWCSLSRATSTPESSFSMSDNASDESLSPSSNSLAATVCVGA